MSLISSELREYIERLESLKTPSSEILTEGLINDIFKKLFGGIRPGKQLSPAQQEAIYGYTKADYRRINHYLKTTAGEEYNSVIPLEYDKMDMKQKSELIASAFTPRNTNKRKMIVYSGTSPAVVQQIVANKAKQQVFTKFVSTTTEIQTALDFGINNAEEPRNPHLLKCILPPGVGLSVEEFSGNPAEHEVLLNYGTRFVFKDLVDDGDFFTGDEDDILPDVDVVTVCTIEVLPPSPH